MAYNVISDKIFRVIFDPGHGGLDVGAVGTDPNTKKPVYEKNLNWQLSVATKEWLKKYPIEVIIVQPSCTNPKSTGKDELYKPVAEANRIHKVDHVDLFLSFHTNAGKGTGTEIFCSRNASEASRRYRDILHDHIAPYMSSWHYVDRGEKGAKYYVLTYTKMPSVLIETLFIDTSRDVKALTNQDFMAGLSSVIAAAICDMAGVEWKG